MSAATVRPVPKAEEVQLSGQGQQILTIGQKAVELASNSVTKQITGAMEAIGNVAQKGTIVFLQSFGAALIVLCIAAKIKVGNYELAALTGSEYIVTVLVGLLFILAGSAIRFYVLKAAIEEQRAIGEAGRDIMQSQSKAAIDQMELITKAASPAITPKPGIDANMNV